TRCAFHHRRSTLRRPWCGAARAYRGRERESRSVGAPEEVGRRSWGDKTEPILCHRCYGTSGLHARCPQRSPPMPSMKSFSGRDRADMSEISLEVTLWRIQPQKPLTRAAPETLAKIGLVGQSGQGRAEFFARPIHQSPACCIDRLAPAAGITNDRWRAAGEGLHDAQAESLRRQRWKDQSGCVLVGRNKFGLGNLAKEANMLAAGKTAFELAAQLAI